jgi:hypothetical protein
MAQPKKFAPPEWQGPDGKPVSCLEKIKVLDQNLEEIRQLCADAVEDAVLMGCDPEQIRGVLRHLVDSLDHPLAEQTKK